jgi:hypothetical protein
MQSHPSRLISAATVRDICGGRFGHDARALAAETNTELSKANPDRTPPILEGGMLVEWLDAKCSKNADRGR